MTWRSFVVVRCFTRRAAASSPAVHYALGDMLALGWLPTEDAVLGSDHQESRMPKCPNENGYEGYRDGDHAV